MNKFFKFAICGFVAATAVTGFSACSDDDKNEPEKPNTGNVEPGISNVFSEGLPSAVDGVTFTTNEKGQVTKIVDGDDTVTFEYGTFTRAEQYDVLMKLRYTEYPDEGSDIYMRLNKMGFVEYALQVYQDSEYSDDTWKFEYNADGQLTRLQRSEGGDDFTITYSNGDITKVTQKDEDGDLRDYSFSYTNDTYKTLVVNKGNIMMFDDFFRIDMDEMGIAYFAGLLGKSTKNLPMGYTVKGVEGGDAYTDSYTYNWTFNSNNLPTAFWEGDDEYKVTFSWK